MKIVKTLLLFVAVFYIVKTNAQTPIAQWNFNENDGTATEDVIGSIIGDFIGDAAWSEDASEGTSVILDGDGDYVETEQGTLTSTLMASDYIAFTAFFKTNTVTEGQQHILWLGNTSGNGWGPESEINITIGHFNAALYDFGSTILTFYYGSGDVAEKDQVHIVVADPEGLDADSWHHIAGVISDAGSEQALGELYLDGVLLTPLTIEDTGYAQAEKSDTIIDRSTWNSGVLIGVGGNKTQRFFNGNIDCVKVFNEYLDENAVKADMIITAKKTFNISDDVEVFPNPVSGNIIYLKNYMNFKSVEIFDVKGQLIKTFAPNSAAINISELSTGVFVLKTTDNNGMVRTNKVLRR